MALHTTRRRVLAGVGLAAAAGTALLSPGRPAGAPDLARPIPTGTWPVAGHDPARTKHAPDATPPATDIRVAWTAAVPLSAWSPTLTADEDTVYVAEPDGVTALDAADGRIRWRFDTADHWPPDGTEINVGPIVAGDRVLVVTAAAVLALDAATGRIRWARDLRTNRRQAVLVGDALYLSDHVDGPTIVALDVATGGEWYRFDTTEYWSPVAFIDGTLIAISETLASFAPRTGERNWQTEHPGSSELPNTAFAGSDQVVVGSNPLVAVDIDDGTERWRFDVQTGEDERERFRPATDGDRVYISAYFTRETLALDAETGDVVWRIPELLGEPVIAGDTVYCAGGDGITALDAATGDRLGRVGAELTPREADRTLAVAGDRLYLAVAPDETTRNRATLIALDAP